jgi:putative two-component system response regulator
MTNHENTLLISSEEGTILIVDGEPSNIDILSQILEEHYEILCSTNGVDALEVAKQEQPDIIFLDVIMPRMDGYQVCEALTNDLETAHIPVIFITGLSSVIDEAKGLRVGAADYISKPISAPVVQMRVRNHMTLIKALSKLENYQQLTV